MTQKNKQDEFIDIFISYNHDDNSKSYEDEDDPGWVADLHGKLDIRLKQIRGDACNIFRDPQLRGVGTTLSESLITKIENTNFLLVILSPLYINSDWCSKERDAFFEKYGAEEGVKRIIRIDKLPVDPPLPGEFEDKLGYRFYEVDPEKKFPLEIGLRKGKDSARKFHEKINELAYSIRDVLNDEPPVNKKKDNTIYIAETNNSMQDYRSQIIRELTQRRFNIVPAKRLNQIPSKAVDKVDEYLEQSFLSIHIIGEEYEPMDPKDEISVVDLQFREASKFCKENKLKSLVWIPDDIEIKSEKQNDFIESLENDEHISDVIKSSIEGFKGEIEENIELIKANKNLADGRVSVKPKGETVYIFCNKEDLSNESRKKRSNHITDLKDYLYQEGFDVLMPDYLGSESEIQEFHYENLEDCDAMLFYFGTSNQKWNREQLRMLRKNPDFEQEHSLLTPFIYVEKGIEPPALHAVSVVQAEELFDNKRMKAFLQNLES